MNADSLHWLQHCGSWFGFAEPARFQSHQGGGYFASVATGEQVGSIVRNGFYNPSKGLAPWATSEQRQAQVVDSIEEQATSAGCYPTAQKTTVSA